MIEPINILTKIAKSFGSLVLIDGAHAPGVLDIDVKDIGSDYYTGNCHKWLFCPKGSAFLWVSRECQTSLDLQPAVISSSGRYDYVGRFEYTGTRDYTPFATIHDALVYIDTRLGGLTHIQTYCRQLLLEGCEFLIQQWKTDYLVPVEMTAFMANVLLPLQTQEEALLVQTQLMEKYKLSMVFGSVPHHELDKKVYFIRISSQIYLNMEDFHQLAKGVKEILDL